MQGIAQFLSFVTRLEEASVTYMVTGSVAGMVYGEPRLTNGIDVVVALKDTDIDRFVELFPADIFYIPPPEIIKIECSRSSRGHFNIIDMESGFKADMYPIGNDPLHLWAIRERVRIPLGGSAMWLAPIEYVVIRKLMFFREGGSEKHLRDIQGMMQISGSRVDSQKLEELVRSHGLESEWRKVGKEL